MLAALTLSLVALQGPPVTHHFVLHQGGHADVTLHANVRSWTSTRGAIVSFREIQFVKNRSSKVRLTATQPGRTAITVGCDGGRTEVWLVDVR